MTATAFPKFKNVGTMDRELCKAVKEGHSNFRLHFTDGSEDDFIITGMLGDDIELSEEDPHEYDCIFDEEIDSFIILD